MSIGTYVKEMVHSDEGRTSPSVAEIIGANVLYFGWMLLKFMQSNLEQAPFTAATNLIVKRRWTNPEEA